MLKTTCKIRYWGQNSYGATHSNVADWQQRLAFYCGSDSVINAFPVAFLNVFFGTGGVPSINLANVRAVHSHGSVKPYTKSCFFSFRRAIRPITLLSLEQTCQIARHWRLISKHANLRAKLLPLVLAERQDLINFLLIVRQNHLQTQSGTCSWVAAARRVPLGMPFWTGEPILHFSYGHCIGLIALYFVVELTLTSNPELVPPTRPS